MRFALIICLSFVGYSQTAYSETVRYFSGQLTQSKSDSSCEFIEATVTNPLYTHDCDDSASGWNLNVGWEFGDNAVEVGYADLGTVASKAYFYGFPGEETAQPQITRVSEFSASGLMLTYKRFFPVSDNARFFGGLSGFIHSAEGKTYRDSATYSPDEEKYDNNGFALGYGVGFQYKWFEAAYSRISDIKIDEFGESGVNSFSIGFVKTF